MVLFTVGNSLHLDSTRFIHAGDGVNSFDADQLTFVADSTGIAKPAHPAYSRLYHTGDLFSGSWPQSLRKLCEAAVAFRLMNHPTTRIPLRPKLDYGLDSPKELRHNVRYGIMGVIMGPIILYIGQGAPLGLIIGLISLGSGLLLFGISAVMVWGSRVGKLRLRDEVLGACSWRGTEVVLDIGCGHGLMLVGAAKHLTAGKAIGVDVWVQDQQVDNNMDAAMHNADLEGVAERVEVRYGDARDLPLSNASIDVVFSSWMIHFLMDPDDRLQVFKEISRVLKPGGRVVIIDFDRIDEIKSYFVSEEWLDVHKSKPYLLFVTPTHVLRATKPSRST